jgi:putative ABC transport system substrate-binding protein
MRRRDFIAGLGAAAGWPHPALAQAGSAKRVGLLLSGVETDPEARAGMAAFQRTLQQLGWSVGPLNLRQLGPVHTGRTR